MPITTPLPFLVVLGVLGGLARYVVDVVLAWLLLQQNGTQHTALSRQAAKSPTRHSRYGDGANAKDGEERQSLF